MRIKAWKTSGLMTNPTSGTTIADTGTTAIDTGNYSVKLPISATAISRVIVEFWSADEIVEKIRDHTFHLAAGIPNPPEFLSNFPFTRPFRVYLKMAAALTGNIQGTIIVE